MGAGEQTGTAEHRTLDVIELKVNEEVTDA
jgi:hypothetical protein